MITINPALLNADGTPDAALLLAILQRHRGERERLDELLRIYNREHPIASRVRLKGLPNNRLAHDLPGYIVTMAAGYLIGRPVVYTPSEDTRKEFEPISQALAAACADSVDMELAADASIFGRGVEVCYADGKSRPRIAQMDVRTSFVVYDDTVEHNPLLGISLRDLYDRNFQRSGEHVTVYTASEIVGYERVGEEAPAEKGRKPHYFGGVPIIEYWNNSREQGDFEPVIDLINAYDVLQSDRMNDKQQFTDSILALYGVGALGLDDTEEYAQNPGTGEIEELPPERKEKLTPSQRLRQTKTLFMPNGDTKAEFLTKPMSEADTEVLRESLKNDIHKLCLVPDMTDEEFAGNVSGVAMRFKLLGLEQLTRIKERWFREGLRSRLRLFANFLKRKGAPAVDTDAVQISFTRSLPANELEIAQTVATYQGMVPQQLLLGQVPFVEDAEEAMVMLEQEQNAAVERQQKAFAAQDFREHQGEEQKSGKGEASEQERRPEG